MLDQGSANFDPRSKSGARLGHIHPCPSSAHCLCLLLCYNSRADNWSWQRSRPPSLPYLLSGSLPKKKNCQLWARLKQLIYYISAQGSIQGWTCGFNWSNQSESQEFSLAYSWRESLAPSEWQWFADLRLCNTAASLATSEASLRN